MNSYTDQHHQQGQQNDQVLAYLNNTLSAAETRKIEESLSEDQMLDDALEGLRMVDLEEASKIDTQLKFFIKTKIANSSRKKTLISFPYWLMMTIILLLILISVGYFVVTQLLN
ncbi:MAG: hypothetical protein RL642_239 [Bacteroidota bacterium]|jgi:hypothetical protein